MYTGNQKVFVLFATNSFVMALVGVNLKIYNTKVRHSKQWFESIDLTVEKIHQLGKALLHFSILI